MIKNKTICCSLLVLSTLLGSPAEATKPLGQLMHGGHRHGGGHHHWGPRSYGYYDPGYYDYGGDYFWGGFPNVIINVPTRPYYPPICEDVEICDPYDGCWIEQRCSR